MRFLQRLDERIRMLVFCGICMDDLRFGALDLERGTARGGEELGWCYGKGEDVGGVGGRGVGLEVLFGLPQSVCFYLRIHWATHHCGYASIRLASWNGDIP